MSTYDNFITDHTDFRKKLGERTFWELPDDTRQGWFAGFAHCYMMLEPLPEDKDRKVRTMFHAVHEEFARRTAFVLCNGLT